MKESREKKNQKIVRKKNFIKQIIIVMNIYIKKRIAKGIRKSIEKYGDQDNELLILVLWLQLQQLCG